jgi:beta-aspartyl-peptidase (threonine type)
LRRDDMSEARAALYHAGLRCALAAGRDVLAGNGSALDAVTAAVAALEDDPLFNAGRGAVFTAAGAQEMDAAIMDGREHRAGAVAGICGPKNPILAARAVMEHSPHVLLIGEGALAFCQAQRLAFVDRDYFYTEDRWQALQRTLERRRRGLGDDAGDDDEARRHGTVGAVARDRAGNLAAATSTGGMTGKLPGRVGDSPIIGAGTYADNASCAVSATGHGEIFIRFAAAHEIAARMRHCRQPLAEAAREVVEKLARVGGSGGLVAVDRDGALALPVNCSGMYRGYATEDGILHTAIYDEPYRSP